MRIGKKLKATLDFLGKSYVLKTIDGELCIYRDMKNGFDIEVSGVSKSGKSTGCNFVAVWQTRGGTQIAECIHDVKDLKQLKAVLDKVVEKYGANKLPPSLST